MISHEDWFRELRKPKRPSYVESGDDIIPPIKHVGNVPFGKDGEQIYIKDVLHVAVITKNLVSDSQIVEQGIQARSTTEVSSLRSV